MMQNREEDRVGKVRMPVEAAKRKALRSLWVALELKSTQTHRPGQVMLHQVLLKDPRHVDNGPVRRYPLAVVNHYAEAVIMAQLS